MCTAHSRYIYGEKEDKALHKLNRRRRGAPGLEKNEEGEGETGSINRYSHGL